MKPGRSTATKTEVLKLDGSADDAERLRLAGRAVRERKLVAFPTETVWGLGANASAPEALARLAEVRGDPPRPYTILLGLAAEAERQAAPLSRPAAKLARLYWPGPLTLVVPARDDPRRRIGLRVPNHWVARQLATEALSPLAAPSANRAGEPPARTAAEVLAVFDGRIEYVLDGGPAPAGRASTVVAVEGERVEVRREGELTRAGVEEAARLTILFVCEGNTCRSPMAEQLCRKLLTGRAPPRGGGLGAAVLSAGMSALPDAPAAPEALAALREVGLDLAAHRARLLSVRLVELADRIFVMETAQERALVELMPEAAGRIRMLDRSCRNIPDPAGGTLPAYRRCRDELAACLREVLGELEPQP